MMEKNQSNQFPQKTQSNRYFVAGSIGLTNVLIELGFEEIESKGSGINTIKIFNKGNKYVKSAYHILYLYVKDKSGEDKIVEKGFIVNAENLKFFANRSPQTIITNDKE